MLNCRPINYARIRVSFFFRPLAIALTFLMLPPVGWLAPASGVSEVQAQDACGNRILQAACEPGAPAAELMQFEDDSVQKYLALHNLPASEASLIYEYGRTDLRSHVRAFMEARLTDLLGRTDWVGYEQVVAGWFGLRVWDKEKALYQRAVDNKNSWYEDPCNWEIDPDIAAAYGIYYKRIQFCTDTFATLIQSAPSVPSKSYYLAEALKHSYTQPIIDDPSGPRVMLETAGLLPTAYAWAAAPAIVAGAAVGFLLTFKFASFSTAVFPFMAKTLELAAIRGAQAVGWAGGAVAFVAVVIVMAIYIGIVAGIAAGETQDILDALDELDDQLVRAQTIPPDFRAFMDSSEGSYKLHATFIEATLPEFESTSPVPSATVTPNFLISPPGGSHQILRYRDWYGVSWDAYNYNGWIVQHSSDGRSSFVTTLRVLNWDGKRYFATRTGTHFLLTKSQSNVDDLRCLADALTGESDPDDPDACAYYVASTIQIKDHNGENIEVAIADPPEFLSNNTVTFTNTDPPTTQTFEVAASGGPLPHISLSGNLPTGITFIHSDTAGAGKARIKYDGSEVDDGTYSVELTATNSEGSVHQSFDIIVGTALQFTSPNSVNWTAGTFASFVVTTSGTPPVSILRTDCGGSGGPCEVQDIQFSDNGDGTGIIFQDPSQFPSTTPGSSVVSLTATNALGSESQQDVTINLAASPDAHIANGTAAYFQAGIENSHTVVTEGAKTRVVFQGLCADAPGWVQLVDNLDNTATLSATPSLSDSGPYTFLLPFRVQGTEDFGGCVDNPDRYFTVYVDNRPVFATDAGNCPVGALCKEYGFWTIETIPTGRIHLIETNKTGMTSVPVTIDGVLPAGLAFHDHSDGSAQIGGIPQPGTGGQYPVILSLEDATGVGELHYTAVVFEAPGLPVFDAVNFPLGTESTFDVKPTGFPKAPNADFSTGRQEGMRITYNGDLPPGITFTDTNEFGVPTGSARFQGTPDPGSEGMYPLTLTADNGVGTSAVKNITLRVITPGDLNADGVKDCDDLAMVLAAMDKVIDEPGYNNLADTNNDGIVDDLDLATVQDTVAPVPSCPGDIVQEPTSPTGNTVTYTPTVSDDCDATPTVVSDPASGSSFDVGTTTEVTVTASDAAGNTAMCTFNVTILSGEEVLADMMTYIEQLDNINAGVANALLKSLRNIKRSLARNKTGAACDQLLDFINTVQDRIDSGKLPPADGQPLIDSAHNLQATLGC